MKEKLLTIMFSLFCFAAAGQENQNTSTLVGDANGDGKINVKDVVITNNYILKKDPSNFIFEAADISGDGIIDYSDVRSIVDIIYGRCSCTHFRDEATGEEAIISSSGIVLYQKENEYGGQNVLLCSPDDTTGEWPSSNCALVEVNENGEICSIVFKDFSLIFTTDKNGNSNYALLKHNGEFENLGIIPKRSRTRAVKNDDKFSYDEFLFTLNDIWSVIGGPINDKLNNLKIDKVDWFGNISSTLIGQITGLVLDNFDCDFSGTISNAASIVFDIVVVGSALNPITASIFLYVALKESKKHVFKELLGKDCSLDYFNTRRIDCDTYRASYFVSGIKDDALYSPEVNLVYHSGESNVGWALIPQTISHEGQNKAYYQDLDHLASGPNHLTMEMTIPKFWFLGSFNKLRDDFFVDFNSLTHVNTNDYEIKNGKIIQYIKAYSSNNNYNNAHPLVEYGTYIRKGEEIKRYNHTENLYEQNMTIDGPSISSPGDGPSMSAVNSIIQLLSIEIDPTELESTGSLEKKVSNYYIGAYTYNFKKGDYEYYDEQALDLRYKIVSLDTGDAIEVKATSAKLNGKVENYDHENENIKYAFLYSTSEDILNSSDGRTVIATCDDEGNLTANLSDLTDYTTYYYAAAYKDGDADYVLGEVKSFKTLVTVTTIENPVATDNSVTLLGICSKGVTIAGFSLKKEGDTNYTQYSAKPYESGSFSAIIDGLDNSTTYFYYAFARNEGNTYIGAECSFTTDLVTDIVDDNTVTTCDESNSSFNFATDAQGYFIYREGLVYCNSNILVGHVIVPDYCTVETGSGDNLEIWTLPVTQVRIYGCDEMTSLSLPNSVKRLSVQSCPKLKKITLPKSLSVLSDGYEGMNDGVNFSGCDNLEEVIFNEGLKEITSIGLVGKKNLFNIDLPNSIEYIATDAFSFSGVKKLKLSTGLKKIEFGTFAVCDKLQSLFIPANIEEIGDEAFRNCNSLNSLQFEEGRLKKICSKAFTSTNLLYVVLPNSLEELGDDAFGRCSNLQEVVLPESLRKIGKRAFEQCDMLSTINFPNNAEIGEGAFYGTMIPKVILHNTLSIGTQAFAYSHSDEADVQCNIPSEAFLGSEIKKLRLSGNITIGNEAFLGCDNLHDIIFDDCTITSLGHNIFTHWNSTGGTLTINLRDPFANISGEYADNFFYGVDKQWDYIEGWNLNTNPVSLDLGVQKKDGLYFWRGGKFKTYNGKKQYSVDVYSRAEGSIQFLRDDYLWYESGEEVVFKIIPSDGYLLYNMSIMDTNGNIIDYTLSKNGLYSFIMPRCGVVVDTSFVEEPQDE